MSDSSLPLELGEAIQAASLNRAPSPADDINPSTGVFAPPRSTPSDSSLSKYEYDEIDGVDEGEEEEDIPYSVIRPLPRRASFPPLPDLRFEQSYLASIAAADTKWKVAYITIRDQV
jgi:Autophagy receptor ATG43